MRLFVGKARATHQQIRCGVQEAHLASFFLMHLEGVRMHITAYRHVSTGRLQVLADGQHVNSVSAQLAQHLQNFRTGLAQPDHQAGLGRQFGVQGLEALQQG